MSADIAKVAMIPETTIPETWIRADRGLAGPVQERADTRLSHASQGHIESAHRKASLAETGKTIPHASEPIISRSDRGRLTGYEFGKRPAVLYMATRLPDREVTASECIIMIKRSCPPPAASAVLDLFFRKRASS